jgi:hypothetical protein
MPDTEGYPTEEELKRVHEWMPDDPKGWLEYIRSIWHWPEWGIHVEGSTYSISTGGWSGNEEIIETMEENKLLWWRTWESTRRGGHYVFRIDR